MPSVYVVNGLVFDVTATYARPADTTAYAAGDALADSTSSPTALTFSGCGRASGYGGYIIDAMLVDSVGASTLPSLELWLFNSSPTAVNDNAAYAISDADALNVVAVLPFTTGYKSSNNAVFQCDKTTIPYKCAAGATALYGLVVVRNAYTPSSAEQFQFRLKLSRD